MLHISENVKDEAMSVSINPKEVSLKAACSSTLTL